MIRTKKLNCKECVNQSPIKNSSNSSCGKANLFIEQIPKNMTQNKNLTSIVNYVAFKMGISFEHKGYHEFWPMNFDTKAIIDCKGFLNLPF